MQRAGVKSDAITAAWSAIDSFASNSSEELPFELTLPGGHVGCMKIEGRKPDYGFLASSTAEDAFLHITRVSAETWSHLLGGGEVSYDIDQDEFGRVFAFNVSYVAE